MHILRIILFQGKYTNNPNTLVLSQLKVVQSAKTKASQAVKDIKKEIDSHMHDFIVVENLGKELATKLHEGHDQVCHPHPIFLSGF